MAPDNPAFKAMEQDLNKRAARAESKRQAAFRWKEKGNAALKAGQPAEALRCYELGALHSSAFRPFQHTNARCSSNACWRGQGTALLATVLRSWHLENCVALLLCPRVGTVSH